MLQYDYLVRVCLRFALQSNRTEPKLLQLTSYQLGHRLHSGFEAVLF